MPEAVGTLLAAFVDNSFPRLREYKVEHSARLYVAAEHPGVVRQLLDQLGHEIVNVHLSAGTPEQGQYAVALRDRPALRDDLGGRDRRKGSLVVAAQQHPNERGIECGNAYRALDARAVQA